MFSIAICNFFFACVYFFGRYRSPTDSMMSPVTKGLLARSRKGGMLLPPSINQTKVYKMLLNYRALLLADFGVWGSNNLPICFFSYLCCLCCLCHWFRSRTCMFRMWVSLKSEEVYTCWIKASRSDGFLDPNDVIKFKNI